MKAIIILLVLLGCFCCAYGQSELTSTTDRQAGEERVQQILATPDCNESRGVTEYEVFLESLRRGDRGDGVHYPWMDRMRQLGVKQVLFVVHLGIEMESIDTGLKA